MFVSGPFGSKEFKGLFSLWLEMYLATFVPGFNRVRQKKTAEAGSFPHMSQALRWLPLLLKSNGAILRLKSVWPNLHSMKPCPLLHNLLHVQGSRMHKLDEARQVLCVDAVDS